MEEKECNVCHKIKPLSEFYKNHRNKDGHWGKCKDCVREYNLAYREANLEWLRAYDRARAKNPVRKAMSYALTKKKRKTVKGYQSAHNKLLRALKSGELKRPNVCECCGRLCIPNAHHEDYSQPLNVIWLCDECHSNLHKGISDHAKAIRAVVGTLWKERNK